MEIYITKFKMFIKLMISDQHWSGISKIDIENWISNFSEIPTEEKYLIYKLLTNIIYFSEKDVEYILKIGVYNNLFGDIILQKQLEHKFQLSIKALENIVQEKFQKTCFIPLLDSLAPHESGNYINRLLVQKGIIQQYQSVFPHNIVKAVNEHGFNRIIIVDDCVGSGDQLRDFWNSTSLTLENKKTILLKEWCSINGIEVYYLVLFGYFPNVEILKKDLDGINIQCVKMLNDTHRVFALNSYIWDDEEELQRARSLFGKIAMESGIDLYGYKGLDFAFIMHQTIPDWSLPIFWKETSDWKCLLRRKNSNA